MIMEFLVVLTQLLFARREWEGNRRSRCHTRRSECLRIIVARTSNILRWTKRITRTEWIQLEWRVYPSCKCISPTSRSAYCDGADDSVSLSFSRLEAAVKFRMRAPAVQIKNNDARIFAKHLFFFQICTTTGTRILVSILQSSEMALKMTGNLLLISQRLYITSRRTRILAPLRTTNVNYNWKEAIRTCDTLYGAWIDSRCKSNCWNAYSVDWFLDHWLLNTRESRSDPSGSELRQGKPHLCTSPRIELRPTCRALI